MAKNTSSKGGLLGKVIALLLVVVVVAYVCTSLALSTWNPTKWKAARQTITTAANTNDGNDEGKNDDQSGGNSDDTQTDEASNFVVNESESTGDNVQLLSAKLPRAAYAANGVSAQAESAYKLTAELEPANLEDKTVNWSVAWKNSSSTWASGKTVTDYVRIVPTSDGALTANAECLQAFAEQVIITVTPRKGFEDVTATCTADYVQKVLGMKISGEAKTYQGNVVYSLNLTTSNFNPVIDFPTHTDSTAWEFFYDKYADFSGAFEKSSVYTKEAPLGYYDYKVCATADYLNALRAGGLTTYSSISSEKYVQNGSNRLDSFFFHNWAGGWFSSSTNFAAFRTSLRNNSDKVMLRVKCSYGKTASDCETCTYNIKFSAESLAAIATNVTVGPNLEF
ncbi:MAG: hypothetical protein K2O41_00505 [Clostridia bacterium]|nr:hypothetical protein [Clostridia bacterium]